MNYLPDFKRSVLSEIKSMFFSFFRSFFAELEEEKKIRSSNKKRTHFFLPNLLLENFFFTLKNPTYVNKYVRQGHNLPQQLFH